MYLPSTPRPTANDLDALPAETRQRLETARGLLEDTLADNPSWRALQQLEERERVGDWLEVIEGDILRRKLLDELSRNHVFLALAHLGSALQRPTIPSDTIATAALAPASPAPEPAAAVEPPRAETPRTPTVAELLPTLAPSIASVRIGRVVPAQQRSRAPTPQPPHTPARRHTHAPARPLIFADPVNPIVEPFTIDATSIDTPTDVTASSPAGASVTRASDEADVVIQRVARKSKPATAVVETAVAQPATAQPGTPQPANLTPEPQPRPRQLRRNPHAPLDPHAPFDPYNPHAADSAPENATLPPAPTPALPDGPALPENSEATVTIVPSARRRQNRTAN